MNLGFGHAGPEQVCYGSDTLSDLRPGAPDERLALARADDGSGYLSRSGYHLF